MRARRASSLLGGFLIGATLLIVQGMLHTPLAANSTQIIIMRCEPMPAPGFNYQVVAFSKTAEVEIDVQASAVAGEGDDCAVAISEILELPGMTTNKMTIQAAGDALVVTLIR